MRLAWLVCALILLMLPPSPAIAGAEIRLAQGSDGTVTYEASAGVGPETPFAIASTGKTMTAVAVLRLVERGLISLDDPVTRRLPASLADRLPELETVRLHHLLTMTSGLPDYYTDDWLEDALAAPSRVQTVEGALSAAGEEDPLFAPGARFDYSNTNYVLLGAVMESVTGQSYARIMQDEVLAPAGMTDSFVFGSRALPESFAAGHDDRALVRRYYSGSGLGDGGIIASARDVARFYRALFVERRLLSDRMLAALLEDASGEGYGMGIEIEDGIAGHSGGDLGFSSDARINLRSRHIAVELVGAEDAGSDWAWDQAAER